MQNQEFYLAAVAGHAAESGVTTMNKNKTTGQAHTLRRILLSRPEMGTLLPLAILLAVVACINMRFFSLNNILDILRTASFSFVIAVPLTFLIAGGGMDLSIGAATSFGGVICALCLKAGVPLAIAVLVALLAGALVGFLNGWIIVKSKLPAFLATLGTQYVVNGIILVSTEGLAISGFSNGFLFIGQHRLFDMVPMPIVYAVVIGVIGHILLARTKFGRSVLAIGGNAETAHLAGINVVTKQIILYTTTSLFAALSGILMASRFAAAQPSAGTGTELTIMAAVIIGGTSIYGGTATVIGTALGCILLSTIQNALIVIGTSTFWQNLIFGIILLISLFVDKYRRKAGSGI